MKVRVPDFQRGKCLHALGTTIADASYGGAPYEGACAVFDEEGAIRSDGSRPLLRAGAGKFIAVRNSAITALLPKRLVTWKTNTNRREVDGYYEAATQIPAGVVDDQLPAAGVNQGNMFWMQVTGLCLCKMTEGEGIAVAAETMLSGLTAAASTSVTSVGGNLVAQAFGTTGATLAQDVQNRVGVAASTLATGLTHADILVDLKIVA